MSKVKAGYTGTCVACEKTIRKGSWVENDGGLWTHPRCVSEPVSDPAPTVDSMDEFEEATPPRTGRVFPSAFDGTCDACLLDVYEGDPIRKTSEGYVHEDCGPSMEREAVPQAPSTPADEFEEAGTPEPPKKELVHRGKYLITDPRTGEFRRFKTSNNINGFTRATTFVKSATDSKALNDWGKRNVVIGAASRPDIASRAYGLKNEDANRGLLDGLVEELYEAANAHVPAEQGTLLHSYREKLDSGELTMDQIPPVWRRNLELYFEALDAYGLAPVKGLSERTTMTHNYGGVAGRFDQVYAHMASGTYLMGDLKTGKTMDYGSKEVPCQLNLYVEGFNEFGVYDEETERWERPVDADGNLIQLRTDLALVLHMPVQGDLAGTFRVLDADLEVGRGYARLCAENRAFKAPKLTTWDGVLPGAPEPPTWEERFASVTSGEEATALWREAKAAGVEGVRLNELIAIARTSLRQGLTVDHG